MADIEFDSEAFVFGVVAGKEFRDRSTVRVALSPWRLMRSRVGRVWVLKNDDRVFHRWSRLRSPTGRRSVS